MVGKPLSADRQSSPSRPPSPPLYPGTVQYPPPGAGLGGPAGHRPRRRADRWRVGRRRPPPRRRGRRLRGRSTGTACTRCGSRSRLRCALRYMYACLLACWVGEVRRRPGEPAAPPHRPRRALRAARPDGGVARPPRHRGRPPTGATVDFRTTPARPSPATSPRSLDRPVPPAPRRWRRDAAACVGDGFRT